MSDIGCRESRPSVESVPGMFGTWARGVSVRARPILTSLCFIRDIFCSATRRILFTTSSALTHPSNALTKPKPSFHDVIIKGMKASKSRIGSGSDAPNLNNVAPFARTVWFSIHVLIWKYKSQFKQKHQSHFSQFQSDIDGIWPTCRQYGQVFLRIKKY